MTLFFPTVDISLSGLALVALYLPVLHHFHANTVSYLSLAAGSTIAGNLLIFGAASNVIIIQNAEKRHQCAPNFWEFARIGLPLVVVNLIVYWVFWYN